METQEEINQQLLARLYNLEGKYERLNKKLNAFLQIEQKKGLKIAKRYDVVKKDLQKSEELLKNLPEIIKEVIDYILAENKTTLEELFLFDNKRFRQQTRNEIHHFLLYFFSENSNYYIGRNKIKLSQEGIGELTGRTHATVINSLKVVVNDIFNSKKYDAKIELMTPVIRAKINAFFDTSNDIK